jgi:signal transduction histidine kinase
MRLSTQILLAFGIVILLSIADSYVNYMLSQKVRLHSDYLSGSEAVIRDSNKTHKLIIDMQSSFRGYLLTDDETFLNSYYRGMKIVPEYLAVLKKRVKQNVRQESILDSITDIHANWVAYSGQLIDTRRNGSESYRQLFESRLRKKVGKHMNDQISVGFTRFDRIEYAVRKDKSKRLLRSIRDTHTSSLVFLSLTIMAGICSTVYIIMLISRRIKTMVQLAKSISQGQFAVVTDTRNDELTGLSYSLNTMSRNLDRTIRELENRNVELSKFAYVVSHDLKAPIRGIHNVTQWIEEDLSAELSIQMRKYLAIISQRTRRMEALINGLLDYARINLKEAAERVDMNQLVQEIANSLVPRGFNLTIDNLPVLHTERIKLEQVFANLISNAVKYTPEANGTIAVTCREMPGYYEFSVRDNGIGIDPAYHDKIFEIFQTLREKDEKESTGIGLAIVKKIMDERGEQITVRSEPGKGAEFIFTWKKIH